MRLASCGEWRWSQRRLHQKGAFLPHSFPVESCSKEGSLVDYDDMENSRSSLGLNRSFYPAFRARIVHVASSALGVVVLCMSPQNYSWPN